MSGLQGIEKYYYYSSKLVEKLCSEVCPNIVPHRSRCEHCRINIISQNFSFAYEMRWISRLKSLMHYVWQNKEEIIKQARLGVAEREETTSVY